MSYLLIIFNLFSHRNFSLTPKKSKKKGKLKAFSYETFINMLTKSSEPIFVILKNRKSFSLEMINEKAASIFGLDSKSALDYEKLNTQFQAKFTLIKKLNTSLLDQQKNNQNEEKKISEAKSSKLTIQDLLGDFSQTLTSKTVDFKRKNSDNSKNFCKFRILHDEDYFIFLIQDRSEIDEITNLKDLNQFNRRLICSFSHEIKTPINGALPNLEILKANIENEELKGLLDRSIGSLKILENSLDNIMAYNLLQENQIFLSKNRFSLKDLLKEILVILVPMIKLKNLNFFISAEDHEQIEIITDYIKLKQILLNLLTNAVQFTLEGEIKLYIEQRKKRIAFFVKDSGMGMSHETLGKLLKKLKEDNQEKIVLNTSGSCLGLLISERLSILMGSENGIQIESKLNQGSEFSFSIINDENYFNFPKAPKINENNTFRSRKKLNSSNKSSLKASCIIEERKQSLAHEQRKKKSTYNAVEGGTDYYNYCSSNSISCLSCNNMIEEKQKNYNFSRLVKFLEEQIPNNTPKIKKNQLMKYKTEKAISFGKSLLKTSTYSQLKNLSKRTSTIIDEVLSFTILTPIKNKFICECEEILYVDDDAFNLLSLELILKNFNLKCCKVMNGLEALRLLEKRKCLHNSCQGFKLIFMDYQMPIMDGIEATKKITEMINNKLIAEVPIIGCTAFVSKDEIMECFNAGMKDVIFKPVNINIVKNVLSDWII